MKILLLLLITVSCGSQNGSSSGGPRCYSKEEAKLACIVDEIRKGLNYDTAEAICSPLYVGEACYNIN